MAVSAFTFYRGAAAVMAADLAPTPSSGLIVQVCGDAHISNFGGFAAPDRRLVFGPNDFDETLPGPWEWDVKRMAASIEIAGRDIELAPGRRREIVERTVRERGCGNSPARACCSLDADELTAPLRHRARRRGRGGAGAHLRQGAAQDQRPGGAQADRGSQRKARLRERAA